MKISPNWACKKSISVEEDTFMIKVKHSYSLTELKKEVFSKDIEGTPVPPDATKVRAERKAHKHHGKKPTMAKCRT